MKKYILLFAFSLSTFVAIAEKETPNPDPDPIKQYTICLGDDGHNTGHCSERVDGLGSSCVKAAFLQKKNCYDEQIRDNE